MRQVVLSLARSLGLAALASVLVAGHAEAATLEPVGSFAQPISITSDSLDPDRLFVAERPGRIAVVDGDGAVPRLYADITGFVSCCGGERGLLSIALAPDFRASGRFYAAYTGKPAAGGAEGDIHVDAFVANSIGRVNRTPVIGIPHSEQANHNGGQIHFGPDGRLYISTGDGGGGGDPFETAQSLTSLLGKILRIAPEPGSSPAYSIPPGNPFAGPAAGDDEIWAYGLRNPWRFSFDSLTGDMLIADVGQAAREEVDLAASPSAGVVGGAGANYGWSCREGFLAYADSTPTKNCEGATGFTDPIFDYPHTDPDPPADRAYGCSITGGYVVRDPSLGDLYGRYLYADYCVGEIRSLAAAVGTASAADRSEGISTANPVSFGEDSCRRLYVASGSTVFRFVGSSPAVCPESAEEEPPPEEEGPTERDPPLGSPPPPLSPPLQEVLPAPAGLRVTIGLDSRFRRRPAIDVRLLPCRPARDDSVQLNRGGKPLSTKPMSGECRARFPLKDLDLPATFRALARPDGDAAPIRSRQLRVGAAPRP